MRILITDDMAEIRELINCALTGAGYDCLEAEHGYAALEVLRQTPCDLVCTDLQMPFMDGRLLAISVGWEWPGLPVMLYSGNIPEDINRGGVFKAVVSKPTRLRNIVATVDELLGIHAD